MPRDFAKSSYRPTLLSGKPKSYIHDKNVVLKSKSDKGDSDDKWKSLLTYRKKNGLCYTCGEKWGHNHKCPQQVSLHVIEELWDALQPLKKWMSRTVKKNLSLKLLWQYTIQLVSRQLREGL